MNITANDNNAYAIYDIEAGWLRMFACNENNIQGYYIRSTCCGFLPSQISIMKG